MRKEQGSSANQSAGLKGRLQQNTKSAENYFNDILGREAQYSDQEMEPVKPKQVEEKKEIQQKPVTTVKQQDTYGSRNDFSDNFSQISEDPDGNFSEYEEDEEKTKYINPMLVENQERFKRISKPPIVKYNPMTVLKSVSQYEEVYDQNGMNEIQQVEDDYQTILYDPIRKKCAIEKQFYEKQRRMYQEQKAEAARQYKEKMEFKENRKIEASEILNEAEPGSLLKIWEGKLDLIGQAKKAINGYSKITNIINVDFWSRQDIKLYQTIPDWPTCLLNNYSSV